MTLKTTSGLLLLIAALMAGAELPPGVPKGSVEIAPGSYQYTDKDKKVWLYRKTPFGLQRSLADEKEGTQPSPAESPAHAKTPFGPAGGAGPTVRAIEDGDSIRFERPTPFGASKWTTKKSELTADERKIWEAQQAAGRQSGATKQ